MGGCLWEGGYRGVVLGRGLLEVLFGEWVIGELSLGRGS